MNIIPIQASSVPCERVFSSGKETMAPQRRHISPKLMECLQMMKYSIQKGRPLNFTQGMQWKEPEEREGQGKQHTMEVTCKEAMCKVSNVQGK